MWTRMATTYSPQHGYFQLLFSSQLQWTTYRQTDFLLLFLNCGVRICLVIGICRSLWQDEIPAGYAGQHTSCCPHHRKCHVPGGSDKICLGGCRCRWVCASRENTVPGRSPVPKCRFSKDICSCYFSQALPDEKVCFCQINKASFPLFL